MSSTNITQIMIAAHHVSEAAISALQGTLAHEPGLASKIRQHATYKSIAHSVSATEKPLSLKNGQISETGTSPLP